MPLTPEELTAAWKLASKTEKNARSMRYGIWGLVFVAIAIMGLGAYCLKMNLELIRGPLAPRVADLQATTKPVTKGELSIESKSLEMRSFSYANLFALGFVFLAMGGFFLGSIPALWVRRKREALLAKVLRSYLEQQGQGPPQLR